MQNKVFHFAKKGINTYYRLTLTVLRKIPKLIWTGFAVLGILFFGGFLGYLGSQSKELPELSDNQKLNYQNSRYYDLIDGYEKLSDLYRKQGENVTIVIDKNMLLNHPEEVGEAFASIEQYKDLINVQMGRVLELRRQAGLEDSKTDSLYKKEKL